jgi:hypothetical protein
MAAISDGFPEGVWPSGLFRFLLERRYLTVVLQNGDVLGSTKVGMNGTRYNVTAARVPLWETLHDSSGRLQASLVCFPTDEQL